MEQYRAKCHTCKKVLKDPNPDGEDPIYVVATDEYYCNQECLDKEKP